MNRQMFDALKGAAPEAFARTAVLFAYLHGSQATGRYRPDSDVDVAVYLDRLDGHPLDIQLDLAERLAGASRIGNLEVLILNEAPLPVRGRAVRERVVIYSRDEPRRVEYESRTLREFFDFEIHAREVDDERLRRHAEGTR